MSLHTTWCWFFDNLQNIVLIATLVVLWGTMRAAERQSEGNFKPVLTIKRKHSTAPGEHEEELTFNPVVPFQITNAGTGPALMVKWRFVTASGAEVVRGRGEVPYIRAAQYVSSHVQEYELGSGRGVFPVTLECNYESASGVHYRSTTKLEKTNKLIIGHFETHSLKWWSKR